MTIILHPGQHVREVLYAGGWEDLESCDDGDWIRTSSLWKIDAVTDGLRAFQGIDIVKDKRCNYCGCCRNPTASFGFEASLYLTSLATEPRRAYDASYLLLRPLLLLLDHFAGKESDIKFWACMRNWCSPTRQLQYSIVISKDEDFVLQHIVSREKLRGTDSAPWM